MCFYFRYMIVEVESLNGGSIKTFYLFWGLVEIGFSIYKDLESVPVEV